MSRSVDVRKWAAWRRRLERFERSGLPVTRFCAAEGVSVASFYLWRKKVAAAEKGETKPRPAAVDDQAFTPVTLVGASTLVVKLPGGTRLQVPVGDVGLLRAALEEIAAADARWHSGDPSC
jgi:hypothetical protein